MLFFLGIGTYGIARVVSGLHVGVSLTIAAVVLVTAGGEPMRRVAIAFAVGEGAALGLLVAVALTGHRASDPRRE